MNLVTLAFKSLAEMSQDDQQPSSSSRYSPSLPLVPTPLFERPEAPQQREQSPIDVDAAPYANTAQQFTNVIESPLIESEDIEVDTEMERAGDVPPPTPDRRLSSLIESQRKMVKLIRKTPATRRSGSELPPLVLPDFSDMPSTFIPTSVGEYMDGRRMCHPVQILGLHARATPK